MIHHFFTLVCIMYWSGKLSIIKLESLLNAKYFVETRNKESFYLDINVLFTWNFDITLELEMRSVRTNVLEFLLLYFKIQSSKVVVVKKNAWILLLKVYCCLKDWISRSCLDFFINSDEQEVETFQNSKKMLWSKICSLEFDGFGRLCFFIFGHRVGRSWSLILYLSYLNKVCIMYP